MRTPASFAFLTVRIRPWNNTYFCPRDIFFQIAICSGEAKFQVFSRQLTVGSYQKLGVSSKLAVVSFQLAVERDEV